MDISYLIIFAIIGFVIWFQFGLFYKASKSQGKDVSDLLLKFDLPAQKKLLLFFSSEHCGPCRAMYPVIEKLKQDYANVISMDMGKNIELARSLGIRATPTLVIIENGFIQKVLLGSQSEAKLRSLLEQ